MGFKHKPTWCNIHEQKHVFGRFGNFHTGVIDDSGLLGCDAMSMIKWFLPCWMNIFPSCSRAQGPWRVMDLESLQRWYILHNARKHLSSNAATHPRQPKSSYMCQQTTYNTTFGYTDLLLKPLHSIFLSQTVLKTNHASFPSSVRHIETWNI
jgi:hypothetical protein